MVPGNSLVDEKQKRTLNALVITPTTLGDGFTSKGLFGFLVSILVTGCLRSLHLDGIDPITSGTVDLRRQA